MLKYIPCIPEYAERNEEYAERNYHFKNSGDFKGTAFQKNRVGGYILGKDEQFTNLFFWKSFKKNLLFAYTENTLNNKISPKSVFISFNNNTNFKIFQVLPICMI
jgi:hypothetical protein